MWGVRQMGPCLAAQTRWLTGDGDKRADVSSRLRQWPSHPEENLMSLPIVALVVLIALVIGAMPTWAHSRNWGYMPSGGLGLIAFVVLVMLATGEL